MTTRAAGSAVEGGATAGAPDKDYAAIYHALAPEYHRDRFGDRPGRYLLDETTALVKAIVASHIADRPGKWLALDVACGTGRVTLPLAECGGRVVALDITTEMLRQCSARASAADVGSDVLLTNGDATKLPFPDGTFDVVCSFRFLHLLPKDVYVPLLQELARVTKPGGGIVVELKNRWYGIALYWIQDVSIAIRRSGGISSYTSLGELRPLARQAGAITLESSAGLVLPKAWWLARQPRLARLVRWLARGPLKPFSSNLVAVYRRN